MNLDENIFKVNNCQDVHTTRTLPRLLLHFFRQYQLIWLKLPIFLPSNLHVFVYLYLFGSHNIFVVLWEAPLQKFCLKSSIKLPLVSLSPAINKAFGFSLVYWEKWRCWPPLFCLTFASFCLRFDSKGEGILDTGGGKNGLSSAIKPLMFSLFTEVTFRKLPGINACLLQTTCASNNGSQFGTLGVPGQLLRLCTPFTPGRSEMSKSSVISLVISHPAKEHGSHYPFCCLLSWKPINTHSP